MNSNSFRFSAEPTKLNALRSIQIHFHAKTLRIFLRHANRCSWQVHIFLLHGSRLQVPVTQNLPHGNTFQMPLCSNLRRGQNCWLRKPLLLLHGSSLRLQAFHFPLRGLLLRLRSCLGQHHQLSCTHPRHENHIPMLWS